MAQKYKCVGCREYKNDEAFQLCKGCEKKADRQESDFEKEFKTPKEIEEPTTTE